MTDSEDLGKRAMVLKGVRISMARETEAAWVEAEGNTGACLRGPAAS